MHNLLLALHRINTGMSTHKRKVGEKPVRKKTKFTRNVINLEKKVVKTVAEVGRHYGVNESTLRSIGKN